MTERLNNRLIRRLNSLYTWGTPDIFQVFNLEYLHLISHSSPVRTTLLSIKWRNGTSLVVQAVKNLPAMQRQGFDPRVRKIPWRREWQPTPVFLPGESPGPRNLAGSGPWGPKELDTTERLALSFSDEELELRKGGQLDQCNRCWEVKFCGQNLRPVSFRDTLPLQHSSPNSPLSQVSRFRGIKNLTKVPWQQVFDPGPCVFTFRRSKKEPSSNETLYTVYSLSKELPLHLNS